ncbi:MAG TPA: YeeE/YedE family protein [Beijerinckiaceae bacterium]|jgi:hypothetical protein
MSTSLVALTPRFTVSLPKLGISPGATLFAGLALLVGAAALGQAVGPRQAALYLLGGALGLVLYHAAFGFTSAWRVFIADRRGAGLRAQMVMLAVAATLFFPVLAAGSLFGQPVQGIVAPIGVSVAFGAFIFGIGMQLGGGCASGTLYTVGGGSTRMLLTLAFFIVGSTVGAAHFHWWTDLPTLPKTSLVRLWGPWTALAFSLALFAAIAALTMVLEKRRHGSLDGGKPSPRHGLARFARGPWPLVAGAVALAIGNFLTLALAGKPWGITSAFALWGSKIADQAGIEAWSWPYWSTPERLAELEGSVFADVTSVMDFGIIAGALLAAGLAGRFAPTWRIPWRSAAAAILGGLLLGYGARLAYGCNIGAYFSGIASGSVHGWVWLVFAFAGNVIGTYARPLFGLEVERTPKLTGC